MSKSFQLLCAIGTTILFSSCFLTQKNNGRDNSSNSLDWSGTYIATKSNAKEVQRSVLNLSKDNKYTIETLRDNARSNDIFSGSFTWNPTSNAIQLSTAMGKNLFFKVGENWLQELTPEGTIKSDGIEFKKTSNELVGKKWKLMELNGKPINTNSLMKEPFLYFNPFDSRVNGNGGCNNMFGAYKIDGLRLSFSKMAMTRMACQNMEIERQLSEVLETVDNYTIADGILSLNKARMAPLAKFRID